MSLEVSNLVKDAFKRLMVDKFGEQSLRGLKVNVKCNLQIVLPEHGRRYVRDLGVEWKTDSLSYQQGVYRFKGLSVEGSVRNFKSLLNLIYTDSNLFSEYLNELYLYLFTISDARLKVVSKTGKQLSPVVLDTEGIVMYGYEAKLEIEEA